MGENSRDTVTEEIRRAREAYQERDRLMPQNDRNRNIYHPRHPLGLLWQEHNREALAKALNHLDIDLEPLRILDFGCGYGQWLRFLVELGARPEKMTGIDISPERIEAARQKNPSIRWIVNDSGHLPFDDGSFDLVLQIVVFSSVFDEGTRSLLAAEIGRVTRSDGYILWIDHKRDHPGGLAGFSAERVSRYFPAFRIVYRDAIHPRYYRTLAGRHPQLARMMYSVCRLRTDSWFLVLKKG